MIKLEINCQLGDFLICQYMTHFLQAKYLHQTQSDRWWAEREDFILKQQLSSKNSEGLYE